MKNKNVYIKNIVIATFTTILLIYFMIKTTSNKLIFVPFLICGFSMVGKNIALILEKKKYANIFSKIFIVGFLLFWFGFLCLWFYKSINDSHYQQLIFSIPFWLAGIYVIKKWLLKTKENEEKKQNNKRKLFNIDIRILITGALILISFISGIAMLFSGIRDTYKLKKKTEGYIATNGYYYDYEIYNANKDDTTYKLTYIYIVDDKEYEITTDYATSDIPEKNSIREIKYNPDNPKEAILTGTKGNNILIYGGGFFTFVSFTFILIALSTLGCFDKFKIDIIRTYIGLLFIIIGIGMVLLKNGETISLIETIKAFGLWILIPIMFIVVGVHQLIIALLNQNKGGTV